MTVQSVISIGNFLLIIVTTPAVSAHCLMKSGIRRHSVDLMGHSH